MRARLELSGVAAALLGASAVGASPMPVDQVVMYEANPRAMSVAGDLDGIIDRLDEISSLGVNTLWIMPIHPIGEVNRVGELGSPYAVRDYLAVNPELGAIEDVRRLVDEAHARGMYVLLDWVANHTAWDHPWVTMHPEWYTMNDQGEIIHPPGTNWLDVADLNFANAEMRSEMIAQMQWWVREVGIDGFRMDAADLVPMSFWSEAIAALRADSPRPLLMLAEGAREDHFEAGFDLTFGWRFFGGLKDVFSNGLPATEIARAYEQEQLAVPMGRGVLRWTTNHDETAFDAPPPVLFGDLDASLAAYASVVAFGGPPLVYSGQEVGATTNTPFFSRDPIDWTMGPQVEDWYAWALGVRQQHAALQNGAVTDRSAQDTVVVTRTLGDERVLAIINTRGQPTSAPLPNAWAGPWADLSFGQNAHLEGAIALGPNEVVLAINAGWPTLVISGAMQTEQGDASDWDPVGSSLVFDRSSAVYSVRAENLLDGELYAFEIVTDRAVPPVEAGDPRVVSGLLAVGDGDGVVHIHLDDTKTSNTGEPVVWIETDAAPLQAVGNFMDEAGGAGDWNPADPAFAMTPLGLGRYVFETTLDTPGTYVFKASFGAGWSHQVGPDGFNNNARVHEFSTDAPGQRVRLFVDLREQQLEAWIGACVLDRNDDQRVDFADVICFLRDVDADDAAGDFDGDGTVTPGDVLAFLSAIGAGCDSP